MKYKIVLKDGTPFEAYFKNVFIKEGSYIRINYTDKRALVIPWESIKFYLLEIEKEEKKEENLLEKLVNLKSLEWKEGITCEHTKVGEQILREFKKDEVKKVAGYEFWICLLYTSPSPRD